MRTSGCSQGSYAHNEPMTLPPYRSYVEISRGRLQSNLHAVQAAVGPGVEVVGVVKADAYGHGAVAVSRILEEAGARWLAVSSVDEGVALREAGVQTRILVMAGFLAYEREALLAHRLTPAVHSAEDLASLDEYARTAGQEAVCHLKIDTGMGRLGSRAAIPELAGVLAGCKIVRLEGLMTHFASAADCDSLQTIHQTEAFLESLGALQRNGVDPLYRHLSSTNAIAYARHERWREDVWQNMVRPGHALYGYVSPARGTAPAPVLRVQPVLTWKAKILMVKDVPEGALIGYGGSYRATRPMRLGVLALGYADGLPHRLSNRGRVIAGGRFAPILGTVSMDLTTIDLTQAPQLGPGDAVTILGAEQGIRQDAQQIARVAGTISYNVLCGIGGRVQRLYVG